jgi:S1-C subfamily serine protease
MRCLLAILLLMPTVAADVTAIYFGADYCQPCRSLRPSLSRLQRDYDVQRVDTSRDRATSQQYEIRTIPQIVFLDDGVEIDRIQGTSPDWLSRCQMRLSGRNNWRPIRAAVRVRTSGGTGSGVILSSVPGRTVIATAAHVVRGESSVTVDLFRDFGVKAYTATVSIVNDTTDLALLTVVANKLPLPSVIGANASPATGDVTFGIGCSGGAGVTVMTCRVQSLDGGDVFASGSPALGRSGGGLYNRRFELIGICSASNQQRQDGWYIGHAKLQALLSEWEPTQYRSGFGVGLGMSIGCVQGPCRNPNCRRCYPQRIPASSTQAIPGPPGRPGATGPRGPAGSDATVDLSPLIQRIEALEKQKRRVMLVDGDGKVIDDESYAADEPIILDVQQLTK